MNWLTSLWQRFRQWFLGNPRPAPMRTIRLKEQPVALEPQTVYLIGEGEYLWFVTMRCPCCCGATVQLNLLPQARPSWEVDEHADGTVSLYPSVWRQKGCRSHFWVRRGRIEWCPTTVGGTLPPIE